MRLIYLDEAGIANARHEPHVVVAGVIVNPDTLAFEIENHLTGIARRHTSSAQLADELIFHASDIWHGTKQFDRGSWSRHARLGLLRDLASVPRVFDLPVVYGCALRSEVEKWAKGIVPDMPPRHLKAHEHAAAFLVAVEKAEKWMRENAKSERAMLIAENAPVTKEALKSFHEGYRYVPNRDEWEINAFQSNHIVETILFAEKVESALLQIADVAAFFIRRHFDQKGDSKIFYDLLKSQVIGG